MLRKSEFQFGLSLGGGLDLICDGQSPCVRKEMVSINSKI